MQPSPPRGAFWNLPFIPAVLNAAVTRPGMEQHPEALSIYTPGKVSFITETSLCCLVSLYTPHKSILHHCSLPASLPSSWGVLYWLGCSWIWSMAGTHRRLGVGEGWCVSSLLPLRRSLGGLPPGQSSPGRPFLLSSGSEDTVLHPGGLWVPQRFLYFPLTLYVTFELAFLHWAV